MTFLSKLGKILAGVFGVITGLGPLIQPYLGSGKAATIEGTVVNDLSQIGQVVVSAEALIQGTGTGATKLAAATPLVAKIIQTSELVSGHQIANEPLFIQGAQKITSGVADILNALNSNAVQVSGGGQPVTVEPPVQLPPPPTVTLPPPSTAGTPATPPKAA